MLTRALLLLSSIAFVCHASDTITLRDGRTLTGSYLGGDSRAVRMVVGEKVQSISIPDIARIEFGIAADTATAPPTWQNQDAAASQGALQQSRLNDAPQDSARRQNSMVEIPSGTNLVVRLIDPVDSETDRLGQTYRASLDEPVVISGETLIPRGADVVAKLVDDKQSGKISGTTVLTLALVSVTLNGRPVDITTGDVSQSSGSRGARSAKVIGGTAAVGAIAGAIFGGGKGAAVGTAAGAGLGTAAQVATKGQKVKIPSETRLTFPLKNPVRL